MTTNPTPRRALMSLCLAACASVSAQEPADAMQRPFSAPVTISASGEGTIGDITGIKGQLADAVRAQLATLRYVPAQRDGVAVDRATHVSGSAVLTPMPDGTFDMHLQDIALAPRVATATPPTYPSGQLRQGRDGSVELVAQVGPDGRIKGVRTVASSGSDFEKAVRQALRGWRFEPRAGADDVEVAIPVWFHVGVEAVRPKFECAMDPRRAHFAGQNGCLDLVEVTAASARR